MPRENDDFDGGFAPVRAVAAAANWPGVEESLSYGTKALKVRGKLIARMKDSDTLVVRCSVEEKEFLMEAEPDVFFQTDHYVGWGAVLMRLSKTDPARLKQQLERAWRAQAPVRLVAEYARLSIKP